MAKSGMDGMGWKKRIEKNRREEKDEKRKAGEKGSNNIKGNNYRVHFVCVHYYYST